MFVIIYSFIFIQKRKHYFKHLGKYVNQVLTPGFVQIEENFTKIKQRGNNLLWKWQRVVLRVSMGYERKFRTFAQATFTAIHN